jgi:hypothetical protein
MEEAPETANAAPLQMVAETAVAIGGGRLNGERDKRCNGELVTFVTEGLNASQRQSKCWATNLAGRREGAWATSCTMPSSWRYHSRFSACLALSRTLNSLCPRRFSRQKHVDVARLQPLERLAASSIFSAWPPSGWRRHGDGAARINAQKYGGASRLSKRIEGVARNQEKRRQPGIEENQ